MLTRAQPIRRAFTLIELLVVVAIIVALIAMLLPSLNRAVGLAQIAVCGSNLRQTSVAALAYRADHSQLRELYWRFDNGSADYPFEAHSSQGLPGNAARALHRRDGIDQGYLPTGEIFFCPTVDLDYEIHYGPDSHGDFDDFWGSYTWHYRPVLKANDPNPNLNTITGNDILFDNAPQTRNIVMADTPAGLFGLLPGYLWGPQFEHYNSLFDDSSVSRVADSADDFGEFMWGSVGRPR